MQYKFNPKTLKPLPCKTFRILQCVYTVKLGRSSPVAQYETANGVIQVPVVYGNYSIGDFVVTNVRTAILDSSTSRHEGIIGQNILSKYKVSIDNRNQVLTLEMPYYD